MLIAQLRHLGAINPNGGKWSKFISSLNQTHNLTGFMVVRHPFDRLVSVYRDKLERDNSWYHPRYGKFFVQRYRRKARKALGNDFFSKANNFGTLLKVSGNKKHNLNLASFWEFAQAVIDRYKMDEHWMPISEYCSICDPVNLKAFKYFLKFENLGIEEELFLKYFQWDKYIIKTEALNENHSNELSGN